MITRLSHATIWCRDHDEALDFYTNKLGFEVKSDSDLDGFRWLTVGPKGQDLQLVLMKLQKSPMMDDETFDHLSALMDKGALGAGVFEVDDCKKTHEELSAKGVEFLSPPAERPYGVEAIMKDNSGNWFSVTEQR